jgi:hypothetical protein
MFKKINAARTAVVAAAVSMFATAQAFAVDIDTSGIEAQINSGATSAGSVAGYVALALAVLATAGVIFGMLRKA